MRRFAVFGLAFGFIASGCGGGGSSVQPRPQPAPTATPSAPAPTATIAFAIKIPARAGSGKQRRPRYVSPATQVVQISVNGGAPTTYLVSNGQPCTNPAPPPQTGTCTVYSVQAPVGTDTFAVTLLDGSNHVLSSGTVQQTIVQDQTNTVNVGFDGTPASLRLSVSNPAPPTGTATRFIVTAHVFDADGFTIIGAPGNLPTLTITDSDSSGATGLYLATSDSSGYQTCASQAAPPSTSVATTLYIEFGTSFYTNTCLAYNGQAIPAATLTASAPGLSSATATFAPVAQSHPSGAWMYGRDSNGNIALERFDANMAPQTEITGSNTQLQLGPGISGFAADAAGNVYTLNGTQINMWPSTASGNVAPTSSTSFTCPSCTGGAVPVYLALDGHGGAYFGVPPANSNSCTINHVALTGSTATATEVVSSNDCGALSGGRLMQLATDGQGYVYVGVQAGYSKPNAVGRYAIGAGGSLTLDAALTVIDPRFTVDSLGNVFAGDPLQEYPAGQFVHGQRVQVSNQPNDVWPVGYIAGIDAAGNVFGNQRGITTGAVVVPYGSRTVSASANFSPIFVAGIR
ncbi:MAG: hypothetical protein JO036_15940 [Candidatus Eremiobacteraeota bacterium]|nr:hypothetical protein [Candidatus Eremiobacteraeota bacterium]